MFLRAVILMLASAMGGGLTVLAGPPVTPLAETTERSVNHFLSDFAQTDLQADLSARGQADQPVSRHDQTQMWGRGQYLPAEHRHAEFSDWQSYHLAQAPEGFRWVRVGRGAYRVNVENGYIAEAVFGLPGE